MGIVHHEIGKAPATTMQMRTKAMSMFHLVSAFLIVAAIALVLFGLAAAVKWIAVIPLFVSFLGYALARTGRVRRRLLPGRPLATSLARTRASIVSGVSAAGQTPRFWCA